MPAKYHIHVDAAPPRVRPTGKFGIVDWREDCSNCHNCVKRACVYGFYRDEADTLRNEVGYLDYIYNCRGCLSCIQDCTKGILTRVVNPEYENIGNDYYTPDIIYTTWYQSETGRIPVSGAGYGGRFCGPGFDAMWTDMSEIVRPTRDGIHGREYINTSVDIGRKSGYLTFEGGRLTSDTYPMIEVPIPAIFNVVPSRFYRGPVLEALIRAAAQIGTYALMRHDSIPPGCSAEQDNIAIYYQRAEDAANGKDAMASVRLVTVPDGEGVIDTVSALKEKNADQIVAIRVKGSPEAANRICRLSQAGAEAIQLCFDESGREHAPSPARHARDVLREVHGALVKDGTRDQLTIIASGGIALAEHMAKAVICGADLVAVDLPLVLALECRLCGECERGEICPIALSEVDRDFAVQRMVNLMGAWHLQLVEMLGAMGIREVRRLRGETGRCMFLEDLERDTFGRLFGARKKESPIS